MTTRLPKSSIRDTLGLTMLIVGMLALAGCPTQQQLDALPGLSEVRPLGPAGQKCYQFCSQSQVACREMCPHSEGICQDDCEIDVKECLVDCPELQRPEPPPKK